MRLIKKVKGHTKENSGRNNRPCAEITIRNASPKMIAYLNYALKMTDSDWILIAETKNNSISPRSVTYEAHWKEVRAIKNDTDYR